MRLFLSALIVILGTVAAQAAIFVPVIVSPDFFNSAAYLPAQDHGAGRAYPALGRCGR
jgi:hypothetical protein